MKVEIGAQDHREGWLRLNIDPFFNPDIIADAFDRLPFQDGSLDELYASHVIEHGNWRKMQDIIIDWGRVIKKDGYIHLKCPDFKYHVKKYLECPNMLYSHDSLLFGICGDQEPSCMRHRAVLDKEWLTTFLENAGFGNMEWDTSEPWELNVRARKQ